jgi:hypothetical protein
MLHLSWSAKGVLFLVATNIEYNLPQEVSEKFDRAVAPSLRQSTLREDHRGGSGPLDCRVH